MTKPVAAMGTAPQPPARRALRLRAVTGRWHRWLGIALSLLWLVQASTGALIVFHWEAADATLGWRHAPTDLDRIAARARALAPPGSGWTVTSIWTSAGFPDRYDIALENAATKAERAVRIDGDGHVLATSSTGARSLIDSLVVLHQTLLAGDTGSWIVGLSGSLLIVGLLLGLVTVWPRRTMWRRAFLPARTASPAVRPLAWHRALGLWAVLPALLMACTGTMLVFEDGTAALVGAKDLAVPPHPGAIHVGLAAAGRIALRAVPGSRLTAFTALPTPQDATYRLRLLAPGEWRRGYGTTKIVVDADNGMVLALYRARGLPWANQFMDALFAIHTGEVTGTGGRLLVMTTGLWLVTMILLGLLSWRRRARLRMKR